MFDCCSTNRADIKSGFGYTAADKTRGYGHHALADYVEQFQSGPRGELATSCCAQYQ